jgi:hypothetical protein
MGSEGDHGERRLTERRVMRRRQQRRAEREIINYFLDAEVRGVESVYQRSCCAVISIGSKGFIAVVWFTLLAMLSKMFKR